MPSPVGNHYDPRIPTLKAVVGHDLGEEIAEPDQITTYLKALGAAAPERARVVEYARSEEGRSLHVLVLGSPRAPSRASTRSRKVSVPSRTRAGSRPGRPSGW